MLGGRYGWLLAELLFTIGDANQPILIYHLRLFLVLGVIIAAILLARLKPH